MDLFLNLFADASTIPPVGEGVFLICSELFFFFLGFTTYVYDPFFIFI